MKMKMTPMMAMMAMTAMMLPRCRGDRLAAAAGTTHFVSFPFFVPRQRR